MALELFEKFLEIKGFGLSFVKKLYIEKVRLSLNY